MEEIDSFENYLESSKISETNPDISKAEGLLERALADMEQVKSTEIDEKSASFIFKNSYDVLRTVINADMTRKGYKPYSHTVVIAYARDVLDLDKNSVKKLNRFRKLRNSIQYRAEKATVEEAEEITAFMEETVREVERIVESNVSDSRNS